MDECSFESLFDVVVAVVDGVFDLVATLFVDERDEEWCSEFYWVLVGVLLEEDEPGCCVGALVVFVRSVQLG